jgi:DNA-binding MarR family transcriptional regulator
MDQPRVSRLVRAAIADGLLERTADQHDGRSAQLLLTAAGRARLEQARRHRRTQFAEAMADWSDDERVMFANLLGRFVAGLDRRDAAPDPAPSRIYRQDASVAG